MKGPVNSGATARGLAPETMGLTLRNLRSAEGKSISGGGQAQVVKRALNSGFWGGEPQSTPLLPVLAVPAIDTQSLDRDHSSAGEHLI